MKYRELFRVSGLPVFQNKMFPDRKRRIPWIFECR